MKSIKIYFSADFNMVPGIRSMIARTAFTFGFSERECYQVETIIDEICNNAIEYGSTRQEAEILLEYRIEQEHIEITVKDEGRKEFSLETILKRSEQLIEKEVNNPEFMERRGRGLYIVKKLSDSLDINVGQEGTTVKVVKRKSQEAEGK